jgi:hypothetical protein
MKRHYEIMRIMRTKIIPCLRELQEIYNAVVLYTAFRTSNVSQFCYPLRLAVSTRFVVSFSRQKTLEPTSIEMLAKSDKPDDILEPSAPDGF